VIEYRGPGIEALSMDERMTVCNMAIEAGARAGMVAPDDTTFAYLEGRPRSPRGDAWGRAVADWRSLRSDPGALFDRTVSVDAASVEPMITFGTNPGMVAPVSGRVPEHPGDPVFARALEYMGLAPGETLRDRPVQVVFVGSCTNARLSDLAIAASVLAGRRVAPGVRMLVVPGSQQVKREAEQRGYAKVFQDAGAEWRESGCSMCLGMNGDLGAAGQYCVSTSNRNFEGRQGTGARTLLASPATAAATAVRGRITDPREFLHRASA
jgi:3-isopropylmalate/(R)-2-methylmalate dehydratase large subunit